MKFLRNNPALKNRRRTLRQNQTEAEKALWAHIRYRQLFGVRFFRQYSVGPYILDFFCPQLSLAIELNGGQHIEEDSRKYDATRSEYLKGHGIEVIRFWNHEVLLDTDSVLSKLEVKITPPSSP